MTKELIERSRQRPAFVDVSLLVTTAALVLSLVIAFTAVSIGIARADTLAPLGDLGEGRLVVTVLIALIISVMGGFTAVVMHNQTFPPRRS